MKKNLLWMFAAILACGIMTTSCEKSKTEIIPINGSEQSEETHEAKGVSIQVKYEATATQQTLDNYALVGTSTLVRYVDADGTVKSQPFTGSFSKTVTIPITATGVDAALQVLILPKTRDEVIAVGGKVDVTTHMRFSYVVNFDDNSQSEEVVFSTEEEGHCSPCKTINTAGTTYDKYVDIFGGFVPAMAHVGFKVNGNSYTGYSSSASFWKDNLYNPE